MNFIESIQNMEVTNYPLPFVTFEELKRLVIIFDRVRFLVPTREQKVSAIEKIKREFIDGEVTFSEFPLQVLEELMINDNFFDESNSYGPWKIGCPLYNEGYLKKHAKVLIDEGIVSFEECSEIGQELAEHVANATALIMFGGVSYAVPATFGIPLRMEKSWRFFFRSMLLERFERGQSFVTTFPQLHSALSRVRIDRQDGVVKNNNIWLVGELADKIYNNFEFSFEQLSNLSFHDVLEIKRLVDDQRRAFFLILKKRLGDIDDAIMSGASAYDIDRKIKMLGVTITDEFHQLQRLLLDREETIRRKSRFELLKSTTVFSIGVSAGMPMPLAIAASIIPSTLDIAHEWIEAKKERKRIAETGMSFLLGLAGNKITRRKRASPRHLIG